MERGFLAKDSALDRQPSGQQRSRSRHFSTGARRAAVGAGVAEAVVEAAVEAAVEEAVEEAVVAA